MRAGTLATGLLMRAGTLAAALLLAGVAACSGGEQDQPTPEAPSSEASPPTATPTLARGRDAAADLSGFVCAPDAVGTWTARGVLTPSASVVVDYAVTVVVAGPDESSASGRRRVLAGVEPGVPTQFEIDRIPVVGSGEPTCQVRVVRLTR